MSLLCELLNGISREREGRWVLLSWALMGPLWWDQPTADRPQAPEMTKTHSRGSLWGILTKVTLTTSLLVENLTGSNFLFQWEQKSGWMRTLLYPLGSGFNLGVLKITLSLCFLKSMFPCMSLLHSLQQFVLPNYPECQSTSRWLSAAQSCAIHFPNQELLLVSLRFPQGLFCNLLILSELTFSP